jgi:hypothetical protein
MTAPPRKMTMSGNDDDAPVCYDCVAKLALPLTA